MGNWGFVRWGAVWGGGLLFVFGVIGVFRDIRGSIIGVVLGVVVLVQEFVGGIPERRRHRMKQEPDTESGDE